VHVVYMPYLGASKEIKTKPAQNAVRDLRSLGIMPGILVARSEEPADPAIRRKLSLYCGVAEEAIVFLPNASTIYEVPLTLEDAGITDVVCKQLGLSAHPSTIGVWREVVARATKKHQKQVVVGVVAKYVDNQDTYMSVFEALRAAAWWSDSGITIEWIDAEMLESASPQAAAKIIDAVDGILVPGGFGTRGLEGKIKAAQYCLKHKKPYLGICLGLQMAVVAAARNNGLSDATSAELNAKAEHKVIHTMADQEGKENTGGTMRLGDYPCQLAAGSLAAQLYGVEETSERHRHRYECNNDYRDQYAAWGIRPVGLSPDSHLVEMIEGVDHPFFMASQFHPEFKSRPNRPHPMFRGFITSLLQKPGE